VTARVVCGFQGHVWSPWQAQIELPTKARQCRRCGRREAYWLTASDYRRTTIPRVEFEGKPTALQRSWAALSITAAWLAGLARLCARNVARWLTAAQSACLARWAYTRYVAGVLLVVWRVDRKLGRPWWKPPVRAHPLTWAEWQAQQTDRGEP
jgi:hypothetical protein